MEIDERTQAELLKRGSDAISAVTGGAYKEFSFLLSQNVALWRFKNGVNIAERAGEYLARKNILPEQLDPKLRDIVPILEYCSYEDDTRLSHMWAALLASYTAPEFKGESQPKYYELLRQLSPTEAAILSHLHTTGYLPKNPNFHYVTSEYLAEALSVNHNDILNLTSNLIRLGLIKGQGEYHDEELVRTSVINLSTVGLNLMRRCEAFS